MVGAVDKLLSECCRFCTVVESDETSWTRFSKESGGCGVPDPLCEVSPKLLIVLARGGIDAASAEGEEGAVFENSSSSSESSNPKVPILGTAPPLGPLGVRLLYC